MNGTVSGTTAAAVNHLSDLPPAATQGIVKRGEFHANTERSTVSSDQH